MTSRFSRQERVAKWCKEAFGIDHYSSIEQRGIRLFEEVVEACQAAECDKEMLHKLVDYVYARPIGDLGQELGGCGVCLLLLANAADLDADYVERTEVDRILSKPIAEFTKRNQEKNDAGFIVRGKDAHHD